MESDNSTKYLSKRIKKRLKNSFYTLYSKKIFPKAIKYWTPKLLRVHIEPTNACNLRCKVCYSQRPVLFPPREKGFMDFQLFKKIIDELSTYGYTIDLGLNFGGESLLHPNFVEMMKYSVSKDNFQIAFTTNGTLLSDEIIKAIIDCRIDNVVVSLDAIGENHGSLRSGSRYDDVKKNIEKLISRRESYSRPYIAVNVTQSDQDNESILSLVNHWIEIVDSVKIYPCLSEDLRFMDDTFFNDATMVESVFCYWPFNYMAILWSGDVTTCCADINGVNIIGNVSDHSISYIWRSRRYRQLRYDSVTNRFPPNSVCYRCNSWKSRFISHSEFRGRLKLHILLAASSTN